MSDGSANAGYGPPIVLTEGPFAGWTTWGGGQDPFETLLGPFAFKEEPGGGVVSGFMPERKHLNGGGAIHGGALMSFADFSLFSIAHNVLKGDVMAVTLTLNGEFAGAGGLEGMVEARGEVVRETGGLLFVRGLITQQGRPLLNFSGVLRKLQNRPRRD